MNDALFMTSLCARYIWTGSGPAIENGEIRLRGECIESVGPRGGDVSDVRCDFGDAIVLPGFVNAHTHLELTHLAGRVPPGPDFIDWLRRIYAVTVASRRLPEDVGAAVADGVAQSLRAGVTTLGDITRHPAVTRAVLANLPMRVVSFGELAAIGKRRDGFTGRLAAATADGTAPNVVVGISPHATYTVEPDLLSACGETARRGNLPACIHVAETACEEEFTRHACGPLMDYLAELGIADERVPASGCTPVELLDRCGLLSPRTILAHVNYISDNDLVRLARSGAAVAYCPRTHAAFGHPPHRFREMLKAGVRVAIGTDSLASNPTLSVLEELRFLRRYHADVTPEILLDMGTGAGASALGFGTVVGAIRPGLRADLVAVPLPMGRSSWDAVLDEDAPDPTAVYISGRELRIWPAA